MGIKEISRRIWLISVNTEYICKKSSQTQTQVIIHTNNCHIYLKFSFESLIIPLRCIVEVTKRHDCDPFLYPPPQKMAVDIDPPGLIGLVDERINHSDNEQPVTSFFVAP